jgi:hypothetical protein
MKATELADIAKKAVAKRNNERPAKLLAEILPLMKAEAERGESSWNHAFSDSVEVLEEVFLKLEEMGYRITKDQGPKKNLTKISWEQKLDTQCGFDIAWVGRCKEPADTTGFCEKHKLEKCRCGRQAVRECEATIGAFVCGHLTCGTCTHYH